ncbi:MAG: hypothetical protein ACD_65C00093G0001 [uncultured bacterium]|nr:MAG: hypothetical protein ACD_65C00093G0001 [uncultured bacterium]
MFEPIDARVLSSCSRNGIKDVDIETICFGEISMCVTSFMCAEMASFFTLAATRF